MKALQDFTYAGIEISQGQDIPAGTFEADQLESLIRKGWVEDDRPAKPIKPAIVVVEDTEVEHRKHVSKKEKRK